METPKNQSTTGANGANGTWDRTLDQAKTGAHSAIDRVSDSARPAVDRLSAGAHQAVDRLSGTASQTAAMLSERAGQLKNWQQQLITDTRVQIREKPVTSLAIAVAAGFLLRQLLRSR